MAPCRGAARARPPPRRPTGCRWPATDGRRGRRSGSRPPLARAGSTPRRSGDPARGVESIHDVVGVVRQLGELAVRQAEAPVLLVVRRPIRDPVGMVRQAVEMRPQLRERQRALARARCSSRRGGWTAGSRRRARRASSGRTRRGCSTPSGPSSRTRACRSGPRGSRAECRPAAGAGSRVRHRR